MKHVLLFLSLSFLSSLSLAQSKNHLKTIGNKDSLYSKTLNETRDIFIQLPESFDANSDQTYPVVYILDAEVHLPALATVHDFYSGGFMPEMIMVGISSSKHRTRDLTTSQINEMYGRPYTEENGHAATFLKFIETELIPHIEINYPVTSYRTLIGHSYGGLFTIFCLLEKPNLFANYLSIDPSLDWDKQSLLRRYKSEFIGANYNNKALFVSLSGQLHMKDPTITIDNLMQDNSDFTLFPRSNVEFKQLMENNSDSKLDFHWKFYPNDLHGTIPLPSIKDGLLTMFQWFQMEHTDKLNDPETSLIDLKRVVAHRADKLKSHFGYKVAPYPEDLINMMGYMSQDMGKPNKSKLYFEYGIEYFPNNPNSYDSMADYYEMQNDYKNALKFASKAFELSHSETHKMRIANLKAKL